MEELTPFKFLSPGWLLLLPMVWWLLWVFSSGGQRQSMWMKICDSHLLENMQANSVSSKTSHWLTWILTIILTLGILAAAGPSWRKQSHPVLESIAARVVVLELSRAMLVEDIKPNRFKQAFAGAKRIVSSAFDGETGLVVFAGAAFIVSPLSEDANTLLAFLDALDPGTMPVDGARVDLAILKAQKLLEASVAKVGQIVIITSGASNPDLAVQAAFDASRQGHRVSVLAVGTSEGGPLINPSGGLVRDAQGNFALAKTDFLELERIAEVGSGAFINMMQSPVQADVFMSNLESGQLFDSERDIDDIDRAAANDGFLIVWLMLPFALFLFRKNQVWVVLLFVMLPSDHQLYARDLNSIWNHVEQRAFEAYQKGDYQSVLELSKNSQLKGAAFYRTEQFQRALDNFKQDTTAESFYNRGNALAQQQKFPDAVVAYKKALALNPEYENAFHNKRLIEVYLEQQLTSESGDLSEPGSRNSATEELEQALAQARLGVAGQEQTNPGDDQQTGPGLGAAMQFGQTDLNDPFDGREQELQRFALPEPGAGDFPDPALIEQWIKSLPRASTDLFRRKFLRDYQRQKQLQR